MPTSTRRGVSRNVLGLGFTSLFTDISSEMVNSVLPVYMVSFLRLSPLEFGIVDGLYQGVGAIVGIAFGFLADRLGRLKEVALLGYGLSALCRLGLLIVGTTWGMLAAIVVVDRTGKGIRTAPRDALISLSTDPKHLGLAFGVHRALDTVGAMLGPLIAFVVLYFIPNGFDVVFVASIGAAVIGLGVLGLFVHNPPTARAARSSQPSVREALVVLNTPSLRAITVLAAMLGLVTVSDGLLYLALQQRLNFSPGFLPLLFVVTSLIYVALAIPVGRLADRLGRLRVFVAGYALLLAVYGALLLPSFELPLLLFLLVLFGAYHAATDGVLMAAVTPCLPAAVRTSGMAVVTTATGVARLGASVVFGALWTWFGIEAAAAVFGIGLLVVLLLGVATLRSTRLGVATT